MIDKQQEWWDKINGVGITFRFITPILIGAVGWFVITGTGHITSQMGDLDKHFSNHLSHHQDLEVGYEKRLTQIEGSRFTYVDGQNLKDKVTTLENKVSVLPPQWLIDQVRKLEIKNDLLAEEVNRLKGELNGRRN